LILAATCALYTLAPAETSANPKHKQLPTTIAYSVEVIDEPGSFVDLNNHEELAGIRFDSEGNAFGVFIDKKERVVTFQCDSEFPRLLGAQPSAINNHGDITGFCGDSAGFIRNRKGVITKFRSPCPDIILCQQFGEPQMLPNGINDRGHVVGELINPPASFNVSGFFRLHGFLFKHGQFTEISVPAPHPDDADIPNPLVRTVPQDINNRGQILGYYETINSATNESGPPRLFIYDNGQFDLLDIVPAIFASIGPRAFAINNDGQILLPLIVDGVFDFYIYDDGHFFRILDPEGFLWIVISGINDKGQLVGIVSEAGHTPEPPFIPPPSFRVIATPVRHGK